MTRPPTAPDDTTAAGGGTTPLLATRALAVQRGERRLVTGLDLAVHSGEVVWLRGRNGCGKTTLLRMLAGLSWPDEGQVLWRGRPRKRGDGLWRAGLLYIGHANALKDDLAAGEALRFLARIQARPADDAALRAALQRLGVGTRAAQPVRTLSQGQRRRVALARLALPQPPTLWLLDEPFDALDDLGIAALNGLLAEHVKRGGAVLMTSHQALSLRDPAPREIDLGALAAATAAGPPAGTAAA
jgi:heme exporter protein A